MTEACEASRDEARPLFVFGPARSGTTLLGKILDSHDDVSLAMDPAMPLFRALRNDLMEQSLTAEQWARFDPQSPFADFYFSRGALCQLDILHQAHLSVQVSERSRSSLKSDLKARAIHESPFLLKSFDKLPLESYDRTFASLLRMIQRKNPTSIPLWTGLKETWLIEFVPALARTFPDARFIVIVRDPRAVLASMLTLGEKDPSQKAHALSYARHCRKHFAHLLRFRAIPGIADRVYQLRYEDLVTDTATQLSELATFLGIDPGGFRYPDAGVADDRRLDRWEPNTSYDLRLSGIDPRVRDRWREGLSREAIQIVDLVCTPEMQLFGYESVWDRLDPQVLSGSLQFLLQDNATAVSWRSHTGLPRVDLGNEICRHHLERLDPDAMSRDDWRELFLFDEVREAIRSRSAAETHLAT